MGFVSASLGMRYKGGQAMLHSTPFVILRPVSFLIPDWPYNQDSGGFALCFVFPFWKRTSQSRTTEHSRYTFVSRKEGVRQGLRQAKDPF